MTAAAASRWVAFRNPGFPAYWVSLLLTGFAFQIQTVAIGWQVYDMTRNPLDLGLVGLSQFAPALLLVLVTGVVADRFQRRAIMSVCLLLQGACAAGMLYLSAIGNANVLPVFALLVGFGTARAFYTPARQAIISNLVPGQHLPAAIAANTGANQLATVCGPVAGGLLYGVAPEVAYGVTLALLAASAVLIARMQRPAQRASTGPTTWATLAAGLRFVASQRVLLGAISLDLFAVVLGGAFALLPVYAADILDVGPLGLGLLRAAPAIGAIGVGLYLMTHPIRRHAGRIMFAAVAVFGLFTLVFALSNVVWLSVLALVVIGGTDMVSVLVRSTLVQLWTPDDLRGRVNAVNQVFIGASNEIGAFRAGATAALVGPVVAVAAGAIGTMAVAGLWLRWFPELRDIQHLDRSDG